MNWNGVAARAAEIKSVGVSTVVEARPRPSEVRDEHALWEFEYTITNPGRLPIFQVEAEIRFACLVRRRHSDGSLEDPTDCLRISAASIPAGSSHRRTRWLDIAVPDWPALKEATTSVSFSTLDAGRCTNTWPPGPGPESPPLKWRLKRYSRSRPS